MVIAVTTNVSGMAVDHFERYIGSHKIKGCSPRDIETIWLFLMARSDPPTRGVRVHVCTEDGSPVVRKGFRNFSEARVLMASADSLKQYIRYLKLLQRSQEEKFKKEIQPLSSFQQDVMTEWIESL